MYLLFVKKQFLSDGYADAKVTNIYDFTKKKGKKHLKSFFSCFLKQMETQDNSCISMISLKLKPKALLHYLHSVGSTVGIGGNDDGQAVNLLHFLASHVEVAHSGNLFFGSHLIKTG